MDNKEQTPDKPIDIENDPRYLELLDEEARRIYGNTPLKTLKL